MRKYVSKGDFKGVYNIEDDCFYIMGHPNWIEKRSINKGELLFQIESLETTEISSLDVYDFYYFSPALEEFHLFSKRGNIINYRIKDQVDKCFVMNKHFL